MKLETEAGLRTDEPSPSEIEHVLATLDVEGNSFAILSSDPLTYVQTLITDNGFLLEYQQGDTDQHFTAKKTLSRAEVASVFQRFARQDASWHGEYRWQKTNIGNSSRQGCAGTVLLLIVAALLWRSVS